jgi:hypothetical protein
MMPALLMADAPLDDAPGPKSKDVNEPSGVRRKA